VKRTIWHRVYIVKCSDGAFYTGYTNDVENRIKVHNSGRGAKSLRGRLPVTLVYARKFKTLEKALRVEYQIKKMTHKAKEQLVNGVSC